jgi:serine/threonine protein kinase
MDGISHPILWKASPRKTEIAIISKANTDERSLSQWYQDRVHNSPLSDNEVCSLAIKIVEILDRIHAKRVRHGNLRPDVIALWQHEGQLQVCIRDFTESRLLGEPDIPPRGSPDSEIQFDYPSTICIHYMSPEVLTGSQWGSILPVNGLTVLNSGPPS